MEVAITFVEDGPEDVLVETTGRGTLTGFTSFIRDLVADERFRPGMAVLVDHSRLDAGALATADARSFAALVARLDELGCATLACVAPQDVMYGISRAFETHTEGTDVAAAAFRTRAEARAWIARRLEAPPANAERATGP